MIEDTIVEDMKKYIKDKGILQFQLANELGASESLMSHWINKKVKPSRLYREAFYLIFFDFYKKRLAKSQGGE